MSLPGEDIPRRWPPTPTRRVPAIGNLWQWSVVVGLLIALASFAGVIPPLDHVEVPRR